MARVLVFEPDRQIRQFVAGILVDFGHDVWQCDDDAGARECLMRRRFDLVATDLPVDGLPAAAVSMVTLTGCRFEAAADKYGRPERLPEKPFRFADLRNLVAAAGSAEAPFAVAA